MRKLYITLAATISLFAASCSNDEAPEPKDDVVTSTLTVAVPSDEATRAFGDGMSVDRIRYIVYVKNDDSTTYSFDSDNTNAPQAERIDNTIVNGFSLSLSLLRDQKYTVVFWADNKETTCYEFNGPDGTLTINYAKMKANSEDYDAFYGVTSEFNAGESVQTTMGRAMAQVNLGTNDLESYSTLIETTSLTFSKLCNKLDLKNGGALIDSNSVDVTLTGAYSGLSESAYPVDGYSYLAMAYVPAKSYVDGSKSTSANITLTVNSVTRNYTNVPLSCNRRTNIYGSLLTSASE